MKKEHKLKHVDEEKKRDSSVKKTLAPPKDKSDKSEEKEKRDRKSEAKDKKEDSSSSKDKEKEKKKKEKEKEKESAKGEKKKTEKGKFFPIKLSIPAAPEPERIDAGMNSPRRGQDIVKHKVSSLL